MRSVTGEGRWGYRDRVCLAANWDEEQWHAGLIRRDELISIPDCPVHTMRVREALKAVLSALPARARFPLVYYVQSAAQVALVVKCRDIPDLGWLQDALLCGLERAGVEGLWLHLNPAAGKRNILAKNTWHLLWGEPRSIDSAGLVYGPGAFQQLLPALAEAAMFEARAFLSPSLGDTVLDLYSGSGRTLREWYSCGARTIGVELGAEAVACSRINAPEATVLRGTCETRLPQLDAWSRQVAGEGVRLAYVNPPRTGLETGVLQWIRDGYRPVRVAYLSCSAGTLERDLHAMSAAYRVHSIFPYDFFPQTYHVETLALLTREAV